MAEKLTLKLGLKVPLAPRAGAVEVEFIKKRRIAPSNAPRGEASASAADGAEARESRLSTARADRLKSILENAKKAELEAPPAAPAPLPAAGAAPRSAKEASPQRKQSKSGDADARRDELSRERRKPEAKPAASLDADIVDYEDDQGRVSNSLSQAMDFIGVRARRRSYASLKRQKEKNYRKFLERSNTEKLAPAKIVREVVLPEAISVKELAERMAEKSGDVIKAMMKLGIMAAINQVLDADTAELIVMEFGHGVRRVLDSDAETEVLDMDEGRAVMEPRAPVVVVMGHVDHGKTSLLDALRKTDVAGGETGGITQHIGAYRVETASGRRITFIDTPGHEAFSAMRARGAGITDIAVLVVAADDSIMPQTVEAISHAKAADVPVIVAINKMDLAGANPDKVRQDLLSHEIVVEKLGGSVIDVEISAKTGAGLPRLEEMILLQADMMELAGDVHGRAAGTVIEARQERGRGATATVLVRKGVLKKGDVFVSGGAVGKVRDMLDERGRRLDEAPPSTPVVVLGFENAPEAGDDFVVVETEAKAREVADYRRRKAARKKMVKTKSSLQELFEGIKEGKAETLPVIIKADTQGSVEAIADSLGKIPSEKVKVKVMHGGVGGINESDISLARTAGAVVLGFNVRASSDARDMARQDGVDIRYYSVIYGMIDDVKELMGGLLPPVQKEVAAGFADVIATFSSGKVRIAGCRVADGVVKKGSFARMLRNDIVVFEAKIAQLKRGKEEVKEARQGVECGISFDGRNDIEIGDRLECFDIEEEKATL